MTTGTLAGTSVGVGALTTDRQTLTVTQATVAADVHKALDVLGSLATKIALDEVLAIDSVTKLRDLILGQVLDTSRGVNAGLGAQLGGGGTADAVDVSQADLDALLARQVDAKNTGHSLSPLLALALLVARVLAHDKNLAMATDNLALVANLLDRRTYLHCLFLSVELTLYIFVQPQTLVPKRIRNLTSCVDTFPPVGSKSEQCNDQKSGSLLITIGDATASQVVRRKLNDNLVTRQNSNIVHTNLARDVSQNSMTVLQLNLEHSIRKRLYDRSLKLDCIFALAHVTPLSLEPHTAMYHTLDKTPSVVIHKRYETTTHYLTRRVTSTINIKRIETLFRSCDNRSVLGNRHRVLEMRGHASVIGYNGPVIAQCVYMTATHRDHRLDSENHTNLELNTKPAVTIIGYIGFFVHLAPNAMTHVLTNHTIAMLLSMGLNSIADVAKVIAGNSLLDCKSQAIARNFEQRLAIVGDMADSKRPGIVANPSVDRSSRINRDDIALAQNAIARGNTVNYFVVD